VPGGQRILRIDPDSSGEPDRRPTAEVAEVDALDIAEVSTVADTGYQGTGPTGRVPQRRRRLDPGTGATGRCRPITRTSRPRTPASADLLNAQTRS
jgi:hypothetical protein